MNTTQLTEILELADNMAAAASQMGMMGYNSLMENRTQLILVLQKI